MTVRELREKYLAFFESKGHTRVASGSLVPYDVTGRLDDSLLFNGAGMVQFKPYFRGVATPANTRLTNSQKCVRTGDIEEVGDATHLTFFEMLGNFSFGDYFKAQAISFSWEFLTSSEWLGLDPTRLSFTVFESDDEAYTEWSSWLIPAGIEPSARVIRLGEETNYWPAGAFSKGPPGPCGPNSEMFYWVSDEPVPSAQTYTLEDWIRDESAGKWVEIWNDVFIQYEWQGKLRDATNPKLGYEKEGMPNLPFASIDTGMGLERTAMALGGGKSVYDSDVFAPIFGKLEELRKPLSPDEPQGRGGLRTDPAARVIADHIRTACFCICDGVLPGNTGRGYVLRRLIRRAILKGQRSLGFNDLFLYKVYEGVVESMGSHYTEIVERREVIVETLKNEETQFRRTLQRGVSLLEEHLAERLVDLQKAAQVAVDEGRNIPKASESWFKPFLRNRVQDVAEGRLDPIAHVTAQVDLVNHFGGFPRSLAELSTILHPVFEPANDDSGGRHLLAHATRQLDGRTAFDLYETYGFPLEVTQELAQEAGLEVDVEGYDRALKEAQARSRGGQEIKGAYEGLGTEDELAVNNAPAETTFEGYAATQGTGKIVRVRPLAADRARIALDRTPFYADSGGQTGDKGHILLADGRELFVENTTKSAGTFWHEVNLPEGLEPAVLVGLAVTAEVDAFRRDAIRRNHTATHLLQAALRKVLGGHVAQAGSYVGPDNLRFDFTHGKALTPEELADVEQEVNQQILANKDVTTYVDLPIAEARAKGAMALFGEKYGEFVRMVEVGEFSRELCGGIHVRTAGEIGLFMITSESSAASGVRRIEAVTGGTAYMQTRALRTRVRKAADLMKVPTAEVVEGVERLHDQLKEERKRREKAEMAALTGGGGQTVETEQIGSVTLWRKNFGDVDPKIAAAAVDDQAAGKANQVTLAAVMNNGKPLFIAKVGADAVKAGAHAGNLLREVAKIAGGGGGGRAEFATAGGRDPEKVAEALDAAAELLRTALS